MSRVWCWLPLWSRAIGLRSIAAGRHCSRLGGMLDVIGRSFLSIGSFCAGMLLVIQSCLGTGFLAVAVTNIHAGHTATHSAQNSVVIGYMATHGASGAILDATAGFGMRRRNRTDSHHSREGESEKFFHYSAISKIRFCRSRTNFLSLPQNCGENQNNDNTL